jgi:hypothetical protein
MVYAKFYVALAAALAVAVTVTTDGAVSLNDYIVIASAFVGALAVRQVANAEEGDY